MPILTTLHTVLAEPTDEQRVIIHELARHSERLVVMSEKAQDMLLDTFDIPGSQIALTSSAWKTERSSFPLAC
jgi:hypothetical protein